MENKNGARGQKWKTAAVSTALLFVLSGCNMVSQNGEQATGDAVVSENQTSGNVDEKGNVTVSKVRVDVSSGITDAVDTVGDAVVSVINMQVIDPSSQWGLFGGSGETTQSEGQLETAGTGSGVIYKKKGDTAYLVTNNHVVKGSDAVEVLFKDGTKVEAKVVGTDLWTDLAVLSIPSEHATTIAEFGDSDALTVGEPAIAIGSPLGTNFASSVTSGIISAIGRTVPVDTNEDNTPDWEMTAIQTDAAINPGNSGGALVNVAGQVVGINSMKISSSTVEGIGFAIPSNDVVGIVNKLEEDGEVIRPVLGVSLVDLSMISQQQQESVLKLPEDVQNGVVVAQVEQNSAAEEAGMQQYDVIVNFNGKEVSNTIELRKEIYSTQVGDEVKVEFYRQNEKQTVTVQMKEEKNGL